MNDDTTRPVPLGRLAQIIGVPAKWLREEAEAGRIPHLKAGDVLLFDPEAVEQIIVQRLKEAAQEGRP